MSLLRFGLRPGVRLSVPVMLAFVFLAALWPSPASAWWNDEWTLRKKITIDTGASGAGISDAIIPLTQIDLADAAGLSVVHINRTFQQLRTLGVLSNNGRTIEVANRERLIRIAQFDGQYLNMPEAPWCRVRAM